MMVKLLKEIIMKMVLKMLNTVKKRALKRTQLV
jgi:hypothetical protein